VIEIVVIALGGSAGAVMRFLVANGIYAWLGRGFPHGTLFVNVSGSFLMGLLTELMLQRLTFTTEYRALILVGFLGAYTTFSTFALETLYLFEQGNLQKAVLNVFLSMVLCLAAVWIGLVTGRKLFAGDLYPWLGHDFSYSGLMGGLALMFLLATFAQVIGQAVKLEPAYRAMALITILGAVSILSSLWATSRLSVSHLEVHGLLSIFAINAVLGGIAVWFGALAGDWLWQIVKSQ
jgi:CrcB protein